MKLYKIVSATGDPGCPEYGKPYHDAESTHYRVPSEKENKPMKHDKQRDKDANRQVLRRIAASAPALLARVERLEAALCPLVQGGGGAESWIETFAICGSKKPAHKEIHALFAAGRAALADKV